MACTFGIAKASMAALEAAAVVEAGKVVVKHGVTLVGYTDLPSRMANVASNLYGNNLYHLLDEMGGAEKFAWDLENDIVRGAIVTVKPL